MTAERIARSGPADVHITSVLEAFTRNVPHPLRELKVDVMPLQRWFLRLASDHSGVLGIWKLEGSEGPYLHMRTGKDQRRRFPESDIERLRQVLSDATGLRTERNDIAPAETGNDF